MKIYILLIAVLSQISVSLASDNYQGKVCNELPYLLVVTKAAGYLRTSAFGHIFKKYENRSDQASQKKKDIEVNNVTKSIDRSICNDKDVSRDLVKMIQEKFKYINEFRKLCHKSKDNNIPAKISDELSIVDERDRYIIHSWRDYHEYSLIKICKDHDNTKSCVKVFAPQFRYLLADENMDEASMCKSAVKEVNMYLKWLQ